MKKILFIAAILAFSVCESNAQTALRGVKNIVTTVPEGTVYQLNLADNVVNVDTIRGWAVDTTDLYLPATPYTTVYDGGGWYGKLGNTFTFTYGVPDSAAFVWIHGNATTNDKINGSTTPVKLSYKTAIKKTSVSLIYVGGVTGWKTIASDTN